MTTRKRRTIIMTLIIAVIFAALSVFPAVSASAAKAFPKWAECNASAEILREVLSYSQKMHGKPGDFEFSQAIAYLAAKNGDRFSAAADRNNFAELKQKLERGYTVDDLMKGNKYYPHYRRAYGCIFKNIVGDYVTGDGECGYGLTAYFPLAAGYWYSHYDDFGSSRSYGFKRKHLGHDLMGSIGTPIVAVEGGKVTELGWNKYGGWRIGIRSDDTERYYYYAHLRRDKPYAVGIKKGDEVLAGQVIGYLGRTGYSTKENQNLKTGSPHLHIGLQLIFDKSQEKGNGEIWVDLYHLTNFLAANRAKTTRTEGEAVSIGLKRRVELDRQTF